VINSLGFSIHFVVETLLIELIDLMEALADPCWLYFEHW